MTVEIVRTPSAMRAWSRTRRQGGARVGFVPTMGYLHAGHQSLMRFGRERCEALVASIFVNPAQFGPTEDLARYPRDLERDMTLLEAVKVDCLYLPDAADIYPPGYRTWVDVEGLGDNLCGAFRPGHFRGVCTVVAKLLNTVEPDEAWFGEKDAQQLRVIRRMARDLDLPTKITGCPTVRESDGLAMSSRNVYLSADERSQAPALHHALLLARDRMAQGDCDAVAVLGAMRALIAEEAPAASIEYAQAVDDDTLVDVTRLEGRVLLALAVRFGSTRLIDNITLEAAPRAEEASA